MKRLAIGAGATLAVVVAFLVVPALLRPRVQPAASACLNNLRMIQHQKEEWAAKHARSGFDVPGEADLFPPELGQKMPACPAGGHYTIGAVHELPTCSVGPPAHALQRTSNR